METGHWLLLAAMVAMGGAGLALVWRQARRRPGRWWAECARRNAQVVADRKHALVAGLWRGGQVRRLT